MEYPDGKLYIGGISGLYVMDLATRNISHDVFPASTGMRRLESFVNCTLCRFEKQTLDWYPGLWSLPL